MADLGLIQAASSRDILGKKWSDYICVQTEMEYLWPHIVYIHICFQLYLVRVVVLTAFRENTDSYFYGLYKVSMNVGIISWCHLTNIWNWICKCLVYKGRAKSSVGDASVILCWPQVYWQLSSKKWDQIVDLKWTLKQCRNYSFICGSYLFNVTQIHIKEYLSPKVLTKIEAKFLYKL